LHAVPHAPQLRGSVFVSMHSLPHFDVPDPQADAHMPCVQTSPALHALPHAPQLDGSRESTVHVSPHCVEVPRQPPPPPSPLLFPPLLQPPVSENQAVATTMVATLKPERIFIWRFRLSGPHAQQSSLHE